MSESSKQREYFDLHVNGIGYLNRVRLVKPRGGAPFLACVIAALRGSSQKVEYTHFDVRVSGNKAKELIERYDEAAKVGKVLIGFRIGDPYAELFTYTKGQNVGKQGVSIRGRLLFIYSIKVNGQLVYKAEAKQSAKDSDSRDPADDSSSTGEAPPPADDSTPADALSAEPKAA